LILPHVEFAYNNSINRSTGLNPFEVITGCKPRKPVDLIPMPLHARASESTELYAQHINGLHDSIRQRLEISNEQYKRLAYAHRRPQEFHKGDYVMIRVKPKRFPFGIMKKLHARGAGPFKILK